MVVYQFKQLLLTPWQKTKIEINDDVVNIDELTNSFSKNPLFNLAGKKREIPIKSIHSLSITRTYNLKGGLIGAIIVCLGIKEIIDLFSHFGDIVQIILSILLLPLGLLVLFCSVNETLCIKYDNKECEIDISLLERETLSKIVSDINERLDNHSKV
ncbi:hypothetical protein [Gilliamella sp. CG16]|uniref:hypothetical protein n=1 Tax=Gilliamella sp. CG16 TaxID=3351503 RepID=UPI0039883103